MRIFLKASNRVGEVEYPTAGFYNVNEDLGREWIRGGLALLATDDNKIADPYTPSAPIVEPDPIMVDAGTEPKKSRGGR